MQATVANRHKLELAGVTKSFGTVRAVAELDLTAFEGEILVLVGPSGCGKTTALRMIAGLETPDTGRIRIDGTDVVHVPPHLRHIGMVFQRFTVYPHLTVFDNIAYPLRSKGLRTSEVETKVARIADLLQVTPYLHRSARHVSGGEAQRVALARAVVKEPKLLLLDEPFSNLDANLRERLRAELRLIHRHIGCTTILVTHDQEDAAALGDRIAVMKEGHLLQTGMLSELKLRPAARFVATFLARPGMNMLEGVLTTNGHNGTFVSLNSDIRVESADWSSLAADTRSVTLGIPPTSVLIQPEHEPGSIPVTVEAQELSMHGGLVRLRTSAGTAIVHQHLATKYGVSLDALTVKAIRLPPEHCFVFAGDEVLACPAR